MHRNSGWGVVVEMLELVEGAEAEAQPLRRGRVLRMLLCLGAIVQYVWLLKSEWRGAYVLSE